MIEIFNTVWSMRVMLNVCGVKCVSAKNVDCWAEKRPNMTVGRRQAQGDDLLLFVCQSVRVSEQQ